MPAQAMGKGQDRARSISSRRNNYYQTLIKSLILLLFQPIARARTGPRHLADPLPSTGFGTIRLLHQNNKRGPEQAPEPVLALNRIKYL